MTEDFLEYTDLSGRLIDRRIILNEGRVGEPIRKRIMVQNRNAYKIRLENPKTSDPNLTIVSYPQDIISPGESKQIRLEYNIPSDATSPPLAYWEFDVAIFAPG